MEQYIHTLIAANSRFFPLAGQIEGFFGLLTTNHHFRIESGERFQAGLRAVRPSGKSRTVTDPLTGETRSIPGFDHVNVNDVSDVSRTVEGLEHYSMLASGEWPSDNRPLSLLKTDGSLFDGRVLCEVSCHLRPDPVSTSCWDEFAFPNNDARPYFAAPCAAENATGVFSHPWTGKMIEVPDAGCARFWIELEFGKFLLPKIGDDLNLLDPGMLQAIQDCFGTSFVQGWRFN